MRKRSRNIIAMLLTVILCFSEFGSLAIQAADGPVIDLSDDEQDAEIPVSEDETENDALASDEPETEADNDGLPDDGEDLQAADVTRLMVWEMLINAFQFTCAVEEYPDNYFNDISGSESYIDTIMLATVMGLTDVEAGQDLVPEGPATRGFAANVMQQTVGRIATSESYTFSDAEDVNNKDAVQAAIDAGWFSLVDGKFLPGQAVTASEFDILKKAAEDAYADRQTDSSMATSYKLKAGVKDLGEKKTELNMAESLLTIVGEVSTGLSAGDVFVVLSGGVPDAYKAEKVTISGGNTIVEVSYPDYDDVFDDLQAHQTESLDLRLAELARPDGGAVISYIVGGTEEEAYEDGEEVFDLSEVGNREVNALVVGLYSTKLPDVNASKQYGIATVRFKVSNLYAEREKKLNEEKVVVYGDMEFGVSIDVDFDTLGDHVLKEMQEVLTLKVTDPSGILYFSVGPDMYVKGELSITKRGSFNAGIIHRKFGADDLWLDYVNKDLDAVMKLSARFGFKMALGAKLWILASAEVFMEIGVSVECKITKHRSNGMVCTDLQAWVYADKGYKYNLLIGGKKEYREPILDYWNSSCRISRHYEDGVEVDRCNYDAEDDDKEGSNPNVRKGRYYTPGNSRFGSGGLSKRTGSNGEVYTIFDYKVDSKTDKATITGYHGNATALSIPDKLDGHVVDKIDSNVFKGQKQLTSVTFPATMVQIGSQAFQDCSNIRYLKFNQGLEKIFNSAFRNCDLLEEIWIPASLKVGGLNSTGAFEGCDGLKSISFEEGTTEIATNLFKNVSGLTSITIPDSVTSIGTYAFYGCKNLKTIQFSANLKKIGGNAFAGCEAIEEVVMPSSLEQIDSYAFNNCSKLRKISLNSGLLKLYYKSFGNCDLIEEVWIPASLERGGASIVDANGGAFEGCDGLNKVEFEAGTTKVAQYLFKNVQGLTSITLPDSIITIENYAFYNCDNLKNVSFSANLKDIGESAFSGCDSIEEVTMPSSLEVINGYAFNNCLKLKKLSLNSGLVKMYYRSFGNCDLIEEVWVPASLMQGGANIIGASGGAFEECDSLNKITFEDGTEKVAKYLFRNVPGLTEISLPDTIKCIETCSFAKCCNMKSISIPDKLEKLEDRAFSGCSSLESIKLPVGITDIYEYTFYECSSLKNIVLPDGITKIDSSAFGFCVSLEDITLPSSLATIGSSAFCDSTALKKVIIPESVKKVDSYAFARCKALQEVTVKSSVPATIGIHAFQDCIELKTVSLSNYVTSIGTYCFDGCVALTEVKLGMGITQIPQNGFSNCNMLESIIIPYYVTTIGKNAFANDPMLSSITVMPTASSIDTTAFSYTDNRLTMYGIKGSYAETFCTNNPGKAVFAEKSVNATKVEFDAESISIASGTSIVPPLTIEPADCTDTITWVSADESIVKVTNGLAKGVKAGSTKLTVTVADPVTGVGKKASINVTVTQGVTGITLNKTKLELDGGEVLKLVATVKPSNADDKRISWTSSDESIATVDDDGMVTAVAKGSCTITVTALDGSEKSATCAVTVKTNLIVASSVEDLQSEHPYPINASDIWMFKDERMNGMVITFSDETMLEADSTDSIIIMDADRKQVGKYTGDQLAGKSVEIAGGNTVYIQLISDGFQSGDYGFAVTGIKAKGTATPTPTQTVTPTPTGGANPTPTPTGGAQPTGGATPTPTPGGPNPPVDAPKVEMAAKGKYDVTALMAPQIPEGKQIAKYKVDNKKVASVSKKGVVTAKKAGTVLVTAYEKTGKKTYIPVGYVFVTVVKPVFAFTNKDLTYTGATIDANDWISDLPEGATISWSIPAKKAAIATIDSDSGIITAGAKNGTVKVTCLITSGGYDVKYNANIKVKIPKPPVTLSIKDGKTKKLTLKNVSKYTEVKWSSASDAVMIQLTGKDYTVKLTALAPLDPEGAKAPIPVTATVDGKEYITYVTIKQ